MPLELQKLLDWFEFPPDALQKAALKEEDLQKIYDDHCAKTEELKSVGASMANRCEKSGNCRRSFVEAHFFQQRLEARLGSQGVETLIDLETATKSILLLITFLQPIEALVLFAESKMEKRPQPR